MKKLGNHEKQFSENLVLHVTATLCDGQNIIHASYICMHIYMYIYIFIFIFITYIFIIYYLSGGICVVICVGLVWCCASMR